MAKLKLTAKFVEGVKVETRTDFWDEICRGLVLRVSPTGVKSWTAVFTPEEGGKSRVTLGQFPAVTLEAARGKALKVMSQVAEGENPAAKKRLKREAMTVAELASEFIERHSKPNKRTWEEDQRMLKVDVLPLIGQRKTMSVTRRDVLDVIDVKVDAGKMAQARLLFALLRKMFGWAVERDIIALSPVTGLRAPGKPQSRDRVLGADELKVIWLSIESAAITQPMREILQLLILTGQRAGEVAGMRYGEVDTERGLWTIPAQRVKNGRAHEVPLSDTALAIIEAAIERLDEPTADTPLFSRTETAIETNAVSKAARLKLQKLADEWTPHDLRRTCATGMAELGVAPHVIEATLNHVSGTRAGVAGIYNRATYAKEKRQALSIWETHLLQVVGAKSAVVVALPRAQAR